MLKFSFSVNPFYNILAICMLQYMFDSQQVNRNLTSSIKMFLHEMSQKLLNIRLNILKILKYWGTAKILIGAQTNCWLHLKK